MASVKQFQRIQGLLDKKNNENNPNNPPKVEPVQADSEVLKPDAQPEVQSTEYDPGKFTQVKSFDPNMYIERNKPVELDVGSKIQKGKGRLSKGKQDLGSYKEKIKSEMPDLSGLLGGIGSERDLQQVDYGVDEDIALGLGEQTFENVKTYDIGAARDRLGKIQDTQYDAESFDTTPFSNTSNLEQLLSKGGREQLLRQQAKGERPEESYTEGMSRLDRLLMGKSTPDVREAGSVSYDIRDLVGQFGEAERSAEEEFASNRERAVQDAMSKIDKLIRDNRAMEEDARANKLATQQAVSDERTRIARSKEAEIAKEEEAKVEAAERESERLRQRALAERGTGNIYEDSIRKFAGMTPEEREADLERRRKLAGGELIIDKLGKEDPDFWSSLGSYLEKD